MGFKLRYKKPRFLKQAQFEKWQAYHDWQKDINQNLQPLGLNYLQAILLLSIHWHTDHDPKITQLQVANYLLTRCLSLCTFEH